MNPNISVNTYLWLKVGILGIKAYAKSLSGISEVTRAKGES
mgnify:CR=1 FL=1